VSFLSGKLGYVALAPLGITSTSTTVATTVTFAKWSFHPVAPAIKRVAFGMTQQSLARGATSGGNTIAYRTGGGIQSAQVECSGPYNYGQEGLIIGGIYTFHLGIATGIELLVDAQIKDMVPDDDVETAPNFKITAESDSTDNPFTTVVV
jgi:hypothetical protein